MNANSTPAQVFALFVQLGVEAFTEVVYNSGLTNAQIVDMTQQIYNMPNIQPQDAARIREHVAQRGREQVKAHLLNAGQTEMAVEYTFFQAGV